MVDKLHYYSIISFYVLGISQNSHSFKSQTYSPGTVLRLLQKISQSFGILKHSFYFYSVLYYKSPLVHPKLWQDPIRI